MEKILLEKPPIKQKILNENPPIQKEIESSIKIKKYFRLTLFSILPCLIFGIGSYSYSLLGGTNDLLQIQSLYFFLFSIGGIQLILGGIYKAGSSYSKTACCCNIMIFIGSALLTALIFALAIKPHFFLAKIDKLYNATECEHYASQYDAFSKNIYNNYFCKSGCPCNSLTQFPNITIEKNAANKTQECPGFVKNYSTLDADLLEEYENKYNCTGVCTPTLYFLFSDINSKPSNTTCMKARLDDFFEKGKGTAFLLAFLSAIFPVLILFFFRRVLFWATELRFSGPTQNF